MKCRRNEKSILEDFSLPRNDKRENFMIQAGTNQFTKVWDIPLRKVEKYFFHIKLDGSIEYLNYKKRRILSSPKEILGFLKEFLFSPIP